MKKILLLNLFALVVPIIVFAQQKQAKDKGYFKELDKGFYEKNILRGIEDFEEPKTELPKRTAYKIDLSNRNVPKSVDEFTGYWKNNPISQGATGTCWSFSTTSFFETEVYRITKKQVKISEMYTAYWEYVEKAIRFIEQRGNSLFDEGSEANAVTRIFKKYGAVPLDAYTGMKNGQSYHNHKKMVDEMKAYLESVKQSNSWNNDLIVSTIKSIMDFYMGQPPKTVKVDGKEISPQQYLKEVLKLVPDDYIDVMSLVSESYWKKAE
jgi:bleomycin hydrolase